MLPEQRGLLSSWVYRFRRRHSGRSKVKHPSRTGLNRLTVERLEDRRLLTNTLFIDFGDGLNGGLGSLSMKVSEWFNLGLAVKQGGASWIHGPLFNYSGDPTVTFTGLRSIVQQQGLQFNVGVQ